MDKIWIWFFIIIFILAISLLMLNAFANAKLKQFYNHYYNVSCKEQEAGNPLCSQTLGCYTGCGSACPPQQKLPILKTFDFFKSKSCAAVCTPQCVCKYGEEFNEETGCVKR